MNSPCWVRLLKISALLQNLTQKFKKLAQGRIFLYERKKRPLVLHALQSIRFLFPTYAENKRILLRTNFQNYRNVFGWRRVVFKCRFNAESEGWQGRFLFRVLIIIWFRNVQNIQQKETFLVTFVCWKCTHSVGYECQKLSLLAKIRKIIDQDLRFVQF